VLAALGLTRKKFDRYVEFMLAPHLRRGDRVMLDNISFHWGYRV
jgi:hypothetical protein